MKRRSFESGGARLILNLDQKEKKGRKKNQQKKKPQKTPNKQTSQIASFQNPWKGVGVYLPWF